MNAPVFTAVTYPTVDRRDACTAGVIVVEVFAAVAAASGFMASFADVRVTADATFEEAFEKKDALLLQPSAREPPILLDALLHTREEWFVDDRRDSHRDPFRGRPRDQGHLCDLPP